MQRLSNFQRFKRRNDFSFAPNPQLDNVVELKQMFSVDSGLEETESVLKKRVFDNPLFTKNDFRIEVMKRNGTFSALTKDSGLVDSGTSAEKADVVVNQINTIENG